MQITKLSILNVQEIYQLLKEQFKDECWSIKQIQDAFNNKAVSFWAIKNDNNLVCVASIIETLDDINLLHIATKNEFKNKGYAKSLLKFLIDLKKEDQTFSLEVKSKNIPAISLYKKLGFNTLNVRKNYYKDGDDALCMFLNKSI